MSRQINQPVASVKLTNVATVRLTIHGKRFEVACYKNKVLDYRSGLETDITEVLQTDNIFTNVSKGEFASKSDLNKFFGTNKTTEQIAIEIIKKGKSIQVSETERIQLYDTTLTQIATWIASNCINTNTGSPFSVWQIKNALTTTTTTTTCNDDNNTNDNDNDDEYNQKHKGSSSKKNKKNKKKNKKSNNNNNNNNSNNDKNDSSTYNIFTVQPNKPLKQQYLQAFKYLQTILPIQRAAMELQWEYDISTQQKIMEDIFIQLNIPFPNTTTTTTKNNDTNNAPPSSQDDNKSNGGDDNDNNNKINDASSIDNSNNTMKKIIFTIDPSLYRPLHELAETNVPGSNLEILRQQVFEPIVSNTTTNNNNNNNNNNNKTINKNVKADEDDNQQQHDNNNDDDDDVVKEKTNPRNKDDDDDDNASNENENNNNDEDKSESDDDDDDDFIMMASRKNQRRKEKKKHQKKLQRRMERVQQHDDDDGDDDDDDDNSYDVVEREQLYDKKLDEPVKVQKTKKMVEKQEQQSTIVIEDEQQQEQQQNNNNSNNYDDNYKFKCNTCIGSGFHTQAEYRAHFRSDWHRYNQKLKLKSIPPISIQEFQNCDAESFFTNELNN